MQTRMPCRLVNSRVGCQAPAGSCSGMGGFGNKTAAAAAALVAALLLSSIAASNSISADEDGSLDQQYASGACGKEHMPACPYLFGAIDGCDRPIRLSRRLATDC